MAEDTHKVIDELKKHRKVQEQTAAELKRVADAQDRTMQAMEAIAFFMKQWHDQGFPGTRRFG